MAERRRFVPLDEEVRVPGECIAHDRHGDEKPEIYGKGDAEHDHSQNRSDGVKDAGLGSGMRTDVVRPEIGERSYVHQGLGEIFPRKRVALQLLVSARMANDFEQLLRDVFGSSVDKMQSKLRELAREAIKDELTHLHSEVAELRTRVAALEAERARAAAESI